LSKSLSLRKVKIVILYLVFRSLKSPEYTKLFNSGPKVMTMPKFVRDIIPLPDPIK
jgi:hypothetical protein